MCQYSGMNKILIIITIIIYRHGGATGHLVIVDRKILTRLKRLTPPLVLGFGLVEMGCIIIRIITTISHSRSRLRK